MRALRRYFAERRVTFTLVSGISLLCYWPLGLAGPSDAPSTFFTAELGSAISRVLGAAVAYEKKWQFAANALLLLWKGSQVEPSMGSFSFAALLSEVLITSQGIAWIAAAPSTAVAASRHIPGPGELLLAIEVVQTAILSSTYGAASLELLASWMVDLAFTIHLSPAPVLTILGGLASGLLHILLQAQIPDLIRPRSVPEHVAKERKKECTETNQQQPLHPAFELVSRIDLTLVSPLLTGLSDMGLTVLGAMLMTSQPSPSLDVWLLPIALSCLVYSYDRVADPSKAPALPRGAQQLLYWAYLCASGGILILEAARMPHNTTAITLALAGIVTGLLYTARIIPLLGVGRGKWVLKWVGLKAIPCAKNLVAPAALGGYTFLAQAIMEGNGDAGVVDPGIRNFHFLLVVLWTFASVVACDCRDYQEDIEAGARTIVTAVGIQRAYMLCEVVISFLVLLCSSPLIGRAPTVSFSFFGTLAVTVPSCAAAGIAPCLLGYFLVCLVLPHTTLQARHASLPLSCEARKIVKLTCELECVFFFLTVPAVRAVLSARGESSHS